MLWHCRLRRTHRFTNRWAIQLVPIWARAPPAGATGESASRTPYTRRSRRACLCPRSRCSAAHPIKTSGSSTILAVVAWSRWIAARFSLSLVESSICFAKQMCLTCKFFLCFLLTFFTANVCCRKIWSLEVRGNSWNFSFSSLSYLCLTIVLRFCNSRFWIFEVA